jgi:hypothetical protein
MNGDDPSGPIMPVDDRSADGQTDVWHAKLDGGLASNAHGFELLSCGGHGGLERPSYTIAIPYGKELSL